MPRATRLPPNQCIVLSIADAAAALGMSTNTFTDLVEAGHFPLVRYTTVAGTPMKGVRVATLDAWAKQHEDRPAVTPMRRRA